MTCASNLLPRGEDGKANEGEKRRVEPSDVFSAVRFDSPHRGDEEEVKHVHANHHYLNGDMGFENKAVYTTAHK